MILFNEKAIATKKSIRWDAHVCPPLVMGSDLSFLDRYKNSGVDFVSLNVGFDLEAERKTLQLINHFHRWIVAHNDKYSIVTNYHQILENKSNDKLSIAFDIEGCNLLNNKIEAVSQLYTLGVRQMTFTYNMSNSCAGGCFDYDNGLTSFGKRLVQEFNDVGMVIDCSHLGYQSSLEIIELSKYPVIFSHSNSKILVDHPRNITDEQIKACADKGGVIGINGVGIFLGNNDTRTERIVEHIEYIAQLVGIEHVGIGLDCMFSTDEIHDYVKNNPAVYPVQYGFSDVKVAVPEQFSLIANLLQLRGYSVDEIDKVLGENFLRVSKVVWK